MNTETHHDMHVETEFAEIVIGGTKLQAHIEGTVEFIFMREVEGGIGDRMEHATRGSEEVTIYSVELTVSLGYYDGESYCFTTTSIDFYEEHFGELNIEDVIGYM
tara:strand:- start:3120 stop:3434 length:315 start_codon:yes stop_codon:yes gene_type:complete